MAMSMQCQQCHPDIALRYLDGVRSHHKEKADSNLWRASSPRLLSAFSLHCSLLSHVFPCCGKHKFNTV